MGRQDFKTNVDQKISDAVVIAKQQESTLKDKQFAEAEKDPLKTYNGPGDYGGINVRYPKTWSSYVNDDKSSTLLNGYFAPGTVPSVTNPNSVFALRFQLVDNSYTQVLRVLNSSFSKKATFEPYSLPKVTNVVGVKMTGQISATKTGVMVVLPLRDKTLQVWTEGSQFTADLENIVLPNIVFSP